MKLRLVKTGKTVSRDGTIIHYECLGTPYAIESRKRHIPHAHANRSGTWDYTSYFVMKCDIDVVEKRRLEDAKDYVEEVTKDDR